MGPKKSPYIGYTEQEVTQMERGYFCVVFGGDFIIQDKFYFFTLKEANKVYSNTLKNLIGIIADGDEKDRNYALDLIANLSIQPMRLH